MQFEDLGRRALDTAAARGAQYADIRFESVRSERIEVRNAVVASLADARSLGYGAASVVEKVQDLMDDHGVEGILRQCEVVDIPLTHAAVFQPEPIQPTASEGQHVVREVEPEATLDPRREQLQDAAGAGAEVEQ